MDAVSDPTVREVWVMKGAQVGWTELLGNVVGFFIEQDPAPMLIIQPTLEMAEAWSKDRFAPMLRDTPALRGKVKDARSRDSANTLLHKGFPGGHATIAGANSAASLASRPVRIVACDEIDRYPVSAGTEGDPIKLAQKRSATFWNRRFLAGSTPTIKGASRIESGFAETDQRRYFVPCVHCGEFQVLEWKQVRWPEGRPQDARYICAHCGAEIDDGERAQMVAAGEWRPTAQGRAGVVGFHIWEAYSPWRRLSEMVADFLTAKPHPELLKVWVNTCLGETWEDKVGEAAVADTLAERAEDYAPWAPPEGPVFAAAGVDVQHDRLEVGVGAWGPGEEQWVVAHEVILGAPAEGSTWAKLDDLLARPIVRADGLIVPLLATVVDAGDGQTTGAVLDYCRARRRHSILAGKGQSQAGKAPIGRPSRVDVDSRGTTIKRGAQLWPIGTDTIKGILAGRLKDEGRVHFPSGLPAAFYEQLSAERLVTKFRNGVAYKQWVKPAGKRNEAWDCMVYAYAAACYAGLKRANWTALRGRMRPTERAPRAAIAPAQDAPVPAVVAAPPKPPRRRQQSSGLGRDDWVL